MDIALITGHSQGLGHELAKQLQNDFEVIGVSRHWAKDLSCRQIAVDISNYKNLVKQNQEPIEGNAKINLILCAGILGKSGGILDSSLEDWESIIRTNLFGNLAIIQSIIPHMIKTQYGRIVFVAGGGAAYGYPLFSGYALSKVAIVREVENISIEMKDKIKDFSIIALAPGAMETNMLKQVRESGAEVKTVVDIQEPIDFIKNFLSMKSRKAKSLSGKFIHVRDNLDGRNKKNKWLLRRIE